MHPAQRLKRRRPLTAAELEAQHQRELAFFNPVTPSQRSLDLGFADRIDRMKELMKEARATLGNQDLSMPSVRQATQTRELSVQRLPEQSAA